MHQPHLHSKFYWHYQIFRYSAIHTNISHLKCKFYWCLAHTAHLCNKDLCVLWRWAVSRVMLCHVSRADTDHVWSTVSGCLWCDHRSVIILWQLGHITISTTHYTYINGPPIVSSLSLILKEYIYLDWVVETWKVFNKLSYRDFLEAVSTVESPLVKPERGVFIHSGQPMFLPAGTTAIVWLWAARCTTVLAGDSVSCNEISEIICPITRRWVARGLLMVSPCPASCSSACSLYFR